MRVFTATLGTETNSFSPVPTGWSAFETAMLWRPGAHPETATEATGPLIACREQRAAGWTVTEGTCAFAWPGGPVRRDVYEALRDEILDQVSAAMPLDFVALGLHGAMMAHGYDDCEGDLLERIRAIVGPQVPVGAVLDLHAHLSARMVAAADLLIAFKEYPHTDFLERSRELIALLARTARGEIHPVAAVHDCRMLIGFTTTSEPWRSLVTDLKSAEVGGRILSASIIQGFGAGDCADMGTKVLVVADGDTEEAARVASLFGQRLASLRNPVPQEVEGIEAALRSAAAATRFPVILADAADNPGGGMAGDNMAVVAAIMHAGFGPACAGPIWDPQAVQMCFEAGLGANISLRVGGKAGPQSGPPLDVEGRVIGLKERASQMLGDFETPLGNTAAIACDGMTIVVASLRDQAYHPKLFTDLGVDPAAQRFIMLKSSQQFRPGFEKISTHIVPVRRDLVPDRAYKKRPHPMWPFETDPQDPTARVGAA
ncbi:MAG: M81 family metallopeptidase [Alphaproteobacteria bacterium]